MALERDLPIKPPVTFVRREIVVLRKLPEEDRARKLSTLAGETLAEAPAAFVENADKRVNLYILHHFKEELKSEDREVVETLYSQVAALQKPGTP
jgi:hypothetical protein